MKICPVCQESNHDAADLCMLCAAPLLALPSQRDAFDRLNPAGRSPAGAPDQGELLLPAEPAAPVDTLALAVYHDLEPRVVAFFPLDGDVTLIGREDAEGGVFPEVDLSRLAASGVLATSVSRRHARLLRHADRLTLEVLPGATSTQLNRDLLHDGARVAVRAGDRIILGARVRMKLIQF